MLDCITFDCIFHMILFFIWLLFFVFPIQVQASAGSLLYVDLHKLPNEEVENDMPVSLRDALVFLELACFRTPESIPKGKLHYHLFLFLFFFTLQWVFMVQSLGNPLKFALCTHARSQDHKNFFFKGWMQMVRI